jgi:hypothetical protein
MPEPLSPAGYAATGGMCCPACGGVVLHLSPSGYVKYGMLAVKQPATCARCGATWTEVYELAGYERLLRRTEECPCVPLSPS